MFCQKIYLIAPNFQRRFIHKYIYKMGKAYFREFQDSDQYQLTFHYKNPDIKVDRQFNFQRNLNESVDNLLGRISTNVEKVVNKKKKKKTAESEQPKKVEVRLECNNETIDKESSCNDVFKAGNDLKISVMDQTFTVILNAPWIDNVTLPSSILASFPVCPNKFDADFIDIQTTDFTWCKSSDKNNWVEVGKGFSYTPTNEDIDCFLKIICIPKNGVMEGPAVETVSSVTVGAGPGICPFETRHAFTTKRLTGKEFRVVSYNILADLYCDSEVTRTVLHPYCPPYALHIDYRKQLFRKEILGFNADLICLQEVDRKVYKNDLEPVLSQLGYSSEFSVKGGAVVEGLTFFYYKSRFELLDNIRMVLAEVLDKEPLFADIWEKISANEKLKERIMSRTTTLQVNVVKSLENNEILVVANIHLYFHPDSDHIRLIQGGLVIKYLEDLVEKLKSKYDSRISLIFCGDFNSVPECGIYKLYTTGDVPSDYIDYQSNKEESIDTIHFTQKFRLASACGTPNYTNFTAGFAACLDYIFYETKNLEVTQVVPFPSEDELRENTALPSVVFPSDHISLIADIKFKE